MKKTSGWRRLLLVLALAAGALEARVYAQAPGLSIQMNAGCPTLSITGAVNGAYSVQYLTNLSQLGDWQILSTVVLTSNPCMLADTSATTAAQRFYRVVATNRTITVTDAQLEDLCSRTCDALTAQSKIPETITIGGGGTSTVTAAELYYLMAKWLQFYKNNHNTPPTTVSITGGTCPPGVTLGVETGTIYLADILTASDTAAAYIDTNHTLPNCSTVGTTQYTTRAMFSVLARTINWYQDHSATMPAYATVRAAAAPDSWVSGIKVAVFSDANGSTTVDCVNATLDILRTNAGFNASTITAAAITNGGLEAFQVVMFPGGNATGQANALGQGGCAQVEQFVARGGGFIGTCAGAYFAALGYAPSTLWLDIVDAQIIDLDNWDRGMGWPIIHLVNTSHPILAGFPQELSVRYINGPLLGPGNSASLPDYEQEAVFVSDIHDNGPVGVMPGTTCLTCSPYGSGRCVLFSFHPELSPGLEPMDVRAVKWAVGKL
jgi:hypothetical protein